VKLTLLQVTATYLIMMILALRRCKLEQSSRYQMNTADTLPVGWQDMGNELPLDTRIVAAIFCYCLRLSLYQALANDSKYHSFISHITVQKI
jgi:hypothetical protein